jgi:hypothetical protein
MVAFKNGFQYVVNSIKLLGDLPQIAKLRAQGKHGEADALISGRMGAGIRDLDAERGADAKARQDRFSDWVRVGGQKGLEGASHEANRSFDEDKQQGELRYLKERKRLIESALKVRPDLAGKISAGTVLGQQGGRQVSASSEDILQGFVPQKYLKNESLQQAATYTQGDVKIGEVKVYINGKGLSPTDAERAGEDFKKAVDNAYRKRKK